MFCTRCGTQLNESAKYCSDCGSPTGNAPQFSAHSQTRLSRPRDGRKIAGVCAGIARYLEVDVTLVRIIAIVLLLTPPFPALLAYIISWIVMPNDPLPMAATAQPHHA